MVANNISRIWFGLFTLAALFVMPSVVAAQSSTFTVPFDRTGTPGTTSISITDPMTGQPATQVVATGAFENPCTFENVDVTGSSTISTVQTTDNFGTMKVNVSVVTRGNGFGWVPNADGSPTFTTSTYTFSESQQFTFRLPTAGEEFASDFSDKLALKGARSIDNWVIRAHFRIKVNAAGEVQVFMIKMSNDNCKG